MYTNLPVNAIDKLPNPQRGPGTSLAPSVDNQIHSYDVECSNYHPSLSTLRSKESSCSKQHQMGSYI